MAVPTLVAEAPEDPINPPPHASHLTRSIVNADLVTIAGMAHTLSRASSRRLVGEPGARAGGGAALDHVEELAGGDIGDRGRPHRGAPPALPGEQHLIEAHRRDLPDPVRVFDQRGAVGDHGVVDGVPVTTEIARDLVHGPAVSAHLGGGPPTCPVGHRQPGGADRGVLAGPRPGPTGRVRAAPAVLVPHQPGRTPESRQLHQLHDRAVLHPHRCLTARAAGPNDALFDMDTDRLAGRSSPASTVTSGSPTSSAHMRVALVSTGAPEARTV